MLNNEEPLYLQVYNDLLKDIESGKFISGGTIPSEKELTKQFEVSRITVKKALEKLALDGYISRMRGKGTFVNQNAQKEANKNLHIMKGKFIGVIFNNITSAYGIGIFNGIETASLKNGYFIIPRRSLDIITEEDRAIDELLELGVQGLIIEPVHGVYYSSKILRLILDGFPIVFIDRELRGVQSSVVCSDNVKAGECAMDYLLNLGHRKTCIITSLPKDTSSIDDRLKGVERSYAKHNIIPDKTLWIESIISNKDKIEEQSEFIKNFLLENKNITSVFALEYDLGILALNAITSIGKNVPNDISIISFDGPSNPNNCIDNYGITHVRQQQSKMGDLATELLINKINGANENKKILLDTEIIEGFSTKKLV
ncbi:MAG TPA: GntR family transcriptional regulator [Ruminiclostridium sp.]